MKPKSYGNVELMKLLLQGWTIIRWKQLNTLVPMTEVYLGIQTSGFGRPSYWQVIYI